MRERPGYGTWLSRTWITLLRGGCWVASSAGRWLLLGGLGSEVAGASAQATSICSPLQDKIAL